MTERHTRDGVSRRGVLRGTAAAGTVAVAGSTPGYLAGLDGPRPAVQNDVEGRTITLEGIVSGWIGVGPAEVDGATGPPLRLVEGVENRVVWINGDGANHNFMIEDEDGDILESTDFVEERGELEELTFTAEPEMTRYYCDPHPVQMQGPIETIDPDEVHELSVHVEDEEGEPLEAEVYLDEMHSFSDLVARPAPPDEAVDDEDDDGDEEEPDMEELTRARFDLLEDGEYTLEVWTYGHERVTEEVTIDGDDEELTVTLSPIETDEPAETFEFVLEQDAWRGVSPDAIADETNPTLELEAEETYEILWENGIGRRELDEEGERGEPLPGHNFVIAEGEDSDEWNTHVRSPFLDREGANQAFAFVAKEELSVYLDQSQLEAVGEVEVSGDGS